MPLRDDIYTLDLLRTIVQSRSLTRMKRCFFCSISAAMVLAQQTALLVKCNVPRLICGCGAQLQALRLR